MIEKLVLGILVDSAICSKTSNQMLNLADKPNGIYFLYVEDFQGMKHVFRVVKL